MMRMRPWVWGLLVLGLLPWLSGCAQLNEWLEGTVGEEETEEEVDPQEELRTQTEALRGDDPAARKDAIGKLVALKLPEALQVVIAHIGDEDPAVASAVLTQLQGLTGFPEKSEDERQLDPEAYDQQLQFKQMVVEQGLPQLAGALDRDEGDLRYFALSVLYNLTKAPVVPDGAREQVREAAAGAIVEVATDESLPEDTRLLAIEALVAADAAAQAAQLVPLLSAESELLRGRAALAFGQLADGMDEATQDQVSAAVLDQAADASQPVEVRWRAAAALGRLSAEAVDPLTNPFAEPKGEASLETYRLYALAQAEAAGAQALVQELSALQTQRATEEEEILETERKKGYR